MPTIVPVRFTYAARDLWFNPNETGAVGSDHVICQTERGLEIGIVTDDPHEVTDDELTAVIGNATLRPVVRIATAEDLARAEELAEKGEKAMPAFRRLVAENELDMKPVGVEYLFDGEKVVCYFAAEERIDFRQLVRDLSHELHERIDMRQIGVREEAAVVGGYGHCGQQLCCERFGLAFEPVSIRMAKEQDLPLNSTKISGACGRLMCCLRYEFEAYRDFKGRAPKRNAVIDTPLGKGKIVEYDTPKEQIAIRLENGKVVRVALADMTASEAAVKKSEELGCACRPDTVSREVLERLSSPDVQMALAELDRKMGVVPMETVSDEDIFVESKRRRRRTPEPESASEVTEPSESAPEETTRRRRRKKRAGAAATPDAAQQPAAAQQLAAAPQSAEQLPATRRRRHHKTGEQPAQRAAEPAAPKAPVKRTRRPGDKGGRAAAEAAARAPKHLPKQEKPQAQPPQKQQPQAGAEGEAAKRRRRHRGGRGRGKGGAAGAAPSAE